ncbi:MAG TPA: hypoxanthine phosphoribosyltransferase [Anaerolineales bacterium]|nr:hypoxanthine phosphoribosyltransferase [Anaerolineales bacterium]
MEYHSYQDFLAEVLVSEEQLAARIKELGEEISADYTGQDILLVCVLRGGVMFLTDLMRSLTVPHMIDFMALSSYGVGARESTGTVRITMDLNMDIYDQNVLIVEDIVDSGHTMASLLEVLETRKPKTLQVCTLLDKASRREVDIRLDYVGFNIEDKFVFGYGLDLDEYYRDLPFVGVVDLDAYTPKD